MTGDNYSSGIIKDVLVATTLERGKYDVRAYLLGISLDLDLPGFAFLSSSLYLRNNPKLSDDTWQLTLAWKYPFQIGETHFITEGFSDIAGDAGATYHHNQYVVPRLLMDISPVSGAGQRQLWLDIEYSYWKNKFGINGVTESHPQIQLKWVF